MAVQMQKLEKNSGHKATGGPLMVTDDDAEHGYEYEYEYEYENDCEDD